MIFWKRQKVAPDSALEFSFQDPLSIDPEPADDNKDHLIRAREANPHVLDCLLEPLGLEQGMRVCDPTCGDGELALSMVELGFSFVGIENDLEKFQMAKRNLEKQPSGHQEDEESEIEPTQATTENADITR